MRYETWYTRCLLDKIKSIACNARNSKLLFLVSICSDHPGTKMMRIVSSWDISKLRSWATHLDVTVQFVSELVVTSTICSTICQKCQHCQKKGRKGYSPQIIHHVANPHHLRVDILYISCHQSNTVRIRFSIVTIMMTPPWLPYLPLIRQLGQRGTDKSWN